MISEAFAKQLGYNVKLGCGRTTLHFREAPSATLLNGLGEWLRQPPKARTSSAPLLRKGLALFTKRTVVHTLSKRLRITRGASKGNGMLDWPIEEVCNTAVANHRGARMPKLVGYGYTRSRLGLVEELFLFTAMLQGHSNGLEWLERNPGRAQVLVRKAFAVLKALHGKGISHMDFWAGNVMVPDDETQPASAVDLENGFTTPPPHLPELLAFQFGFFYHRFVYRYMLEADYDHLVAEALPAYGEVPPGRFDALYAKAKHEPIGRVTRRRIFLEGRV